jgi:hypothetical protein
MMPRDDVLAAAHHATLDFATAAITSADHDRHDLLAHAVEWLATYREHAAFYRHLPRNADQLTTDARAAEWNEHHLGHRPG